MSDTGTLREQVELEVSRQIRQERAEYRGFLEKLFVRVVWAFGVLLSLAIGIFYFYFGDSSDGLLDDEMRGRVKSIVESDDFEAQVRGAANPIISQSAHSTVRKEIADQLGPQLDLLNENSLQERVQAVFDTWTRQQREPLRVGGRCFEREQLFGCYNPTNKDHYTWIGNDNEVARLCAANGGWGVQGRLGVLVEIPCE